MKVKRLVYLFVFVLAGMGLLGSFGASDVSAAGTEKFIWRFPSTFAAGDNSADLAPQFAKRVNDNSKGRLKINAFYGGEILPGDETLSAVCKGVVEMGSVSAGMHIGKYPALVAHANTPFVLKGSVEKINEFALKGEYVKIVEDTFDKMGVKVLGYYPFGSHPAMCSRVPIRSVNDFKGKKIRAVGPIAGLYNALGAASGYIPAGEVYMALQLGTFDAAVMSAEAIDRMKWREVMKYLILPYYVDNYFGQVLVNKAAWAKLPDDLKQVLQEAQQWYFNACHTSMQNIQKEAIDRAKEWGYQVITLPDSEVEKIKQVAITKVWPQIAKDKDSTRVLELIKKWHGVK